MAIPELDRCAIHSASINLVGEAVLTRTAITDETMDRYAAPVILAPGDARLARLQTILRDLSIDPSTQSRLELRARVRITCVDGRTHVIKGSATQPDGLMYLKIDNRMGTTRAPFRHMLDASVASAQ